MNKPAKQRTFLLPCACFLAYIAMLVGYWALYAVAPSSTSTTSEARTACWSS